MVQGNIMDKIKAKNFFLYILYIAIGLCFLIFASCQEEKKKDDFSGVGRLISGRSKARSNKNSNPPPPQSNTEKKQKAINKPVKTESSKDNLFSVTLYEEDVKILGSKSGRVLARGVAYINKKGQIIKIKIIKN